MSIAAHIVGFRDSFLGRIVASKKALLANLISFRSPLSFCKTGILEKLFTRLISALCINYLFLKGMMTVNVKIFAFYENTSCGANIFLKFVVKNLAAF